MIAADTSTWIAFFQGESGRDVDLLDRGLQDRQVVMPPPVLTELLSDPKLQESVARTLAALPPIEIKSGFWSRAGALRASILAQKRKARLGDSLIAQTCLDAGVLLLTRDLDFQAFLQTAELPISLHASA